MERIQSLINRLQAQLNEGAMPESMKETVNQIQAELAKITGQGGKKLGTAKVSVILPVPSRVESPEIEKTSEPPDQASDKSAAKPTNQLDIHFDPMEEIPTLSHQQRQKEVNETVDQEESLNDTLREEKSELRHVLKDSPIRDLRKAIGINDRYVFIHELFRGDEAMFERSLKTINNFKIYPEAEYWMHRELKIKLGWDDKQELVKDFYELVKRRFT